MFFSKSFVCGALVAVFCATLVGPASADQIYIRNRPFKGAVVRDGAGTWVELESFSAAVDGKLIKTDGGGYVLTRGAAKPAATAPAGKVAVGNDLLEARLVDGKTMVSLDACAGALGLRVIPNKDLGTIDVSIGVAAMAEPAPVAPKPHQADAPAWVGTAKWLTSYDEAKRESERSGKPIMMDFTGSNWCGWCMKLKSEVFETPKFKQWAIKNVVLLELDYPRGIPQDPVLKEQNTKLASEFQIQGYPTIIFVDSKGKTLGNYGYDEGGPEVWVKKADAMIAGR